jgi:hypothetical protein
VGSGQEKNRLWQGRIKMDFRSDAANATVGKLNNRAGISLSELGESGCIPLSGGRQVQAMFEIPALLISIVCMVAIPALIIGSMVGIVPSRLVFPLLIANLGLLLVLRRIKSWILRVYLSSRSDSLLKAFGNLPNRYVGMEDGNTYSKGKLLIEDEGVCLLDSEQQRLLIEACSYRYVIYGKDVHCVQPVSGYAMSGTLLDFTVAGQELKVMLSVAGHGPLTSLVESFAPGKSAKNLTGIVSVTLFGTEGPAE